MSLLAGRTVIFYEALNANNENEVAVLPVDTLAFPGVQLVIRIRLAVIK